jgi:hypothetical protein
MLLFYACCFTEKTGNCKSKLASFAEHPGCHKLSLCMSLARRTAVELGPCSQPWFTVTDLLLVPAPDMRYKRLLRRTQKGVLVDLLSLEGLPLAHTVALHISVGACTYCWSDEYLWALLHMNATCVWSMLRTIVNISSHSVGSHEVTARVHMRLIAKNHLVIIEIFVSQVACKLVAELHNFTKLGSNMRPHCSHALHTLGTVCDHHACTPLLKHNLHQLAMLPSCNICPTQLSKTSFHYTLILAYASLAWQAHCTVYRT